MAAIVLLLAAPKREETGYFIASPWPDPAAALGTRESLQAAVRAAPAPAGPELVALGGDDPGGHLALAQAHLQRAEWRMAVFHLNRHAEVADARSAVIARYDAHLIEIGLGSPARLLFEALLDAPTSAHSLAAELFWGARSLLADDRARRWHARMALTGFGRAAGPELRILAEIELARLLWQQSCPIADIGGTCGVMSRVDWHVGCGRVRDALLVVERDAELADEARRRLRSALRRARALPASERLSEAVAQARWLLAESTFEALLRLHRPIGLDFTLEEWRAEIPGRRHALTLANQRATRDASLRRMIAFITRKDALHRQLDDEYDAIIAEADPHTVFAALYRGAQATRDVALHLGLDRDPPPKGELFHGCSDDRLDPLLDAAAERTASCARLAVETGLVDEWAVRCQDAAAEWEPDRFPSREELTPDRASSQPVAFDLVTNLDRDE